MRLEGGEMGLKSHSSNKVSALRHQAVSLGLPDVYYGRCGTSFRIFWVHDVFTEFLVFLDSYNGRISPQLDHSFFLSNLLEFIAYNILRSSGNWIRFPTRAKDSSLIQNIQTWQRQT
jgi:hypothetical protein